MIHNLNLKYTMIVIQQKIFCLISHKHSSKGPCTQSLKFRIRHPFLLKCLLLMWKRRKSNLIQTMIYDGWKFRRRRQCKYDWHNMRSYLFLTCKNFGWQKLDLGLSVQWPFIELCDIAKKNISRYFIDKRLLLVYFAGCVIELVSSADTYIFWYSSFSVVVSSQQW